MNNTEKNAAARDGSDGKLGLMMEASSHENGFNASRMSEIRPLEGDLLAELQRFVKAEPASHAFVPRRVDRISELTAEEIAAALGGKVTKDGGIRAPRPGRSADDDGLSIKLDPSAPDGYLVHSFSGDDPIECRDHVRDLLGLPEWTPPKADAEQEFSHAGKKSESKVVAEYLYRLEDGVPFLRVLRYGPKKSFRQQHWAGDRWIWGKPQTDVIPYRLPELSASALFDDPVFIVEGEKDADRLAALDLVATTSPEGALKWKPALNKWFADRAVFVIADNDKPGRDHATDVARNLHGTAADVRIINLPGLPEKGDVSDWLDAGGTRNALLEICAAAPLWTPDNGIGRPRIASADHLINKDFPPMRYVVSGYFAEGCTILAGKPKLGKSWLMLDAGLAVARGGDCLGAECEQGDVLYIALEDNERRLKTRIAKVLGDFETQWPARFFYATEWPRADDGGLDEIRKWIAAANNPRLVIVDVLAAFRSPRGRDVGPYEADYAALKALQAIASEAHIAVVVVHHLRKAAAESDPFEKVSGTLGLSGAADTVMILDRDGQGVTLYGRGRDVEEIETAVEFDKGRCRWRVLGEAADVRRTDERRRVIAVLTERGAPMKPNEISAATGLKSGNPLWVLLHRMAAGGEIQRTERGSYVANLTGEAVV